MRGVLRRRDAAISPSVERLPWFVAEHRAPAGLPPSFRNARTQESQTRRRPMIRGPLVSTLPECLRRVGIRERFVVRPT